MRSDYTFVAFNRLERSAPSILFSCGSVAGAPTMILPEGRVATYCQPVARWDSSSHSVMTRWRPPWSEATRPWSLFGTAAEGIAWELVFEISPDVTVRNRSAFAYSRPT